MLWFAGERGSMAVALAIKSRTDFRGAGDKFLPFTLGFASITLIASNFLLNYFISHFGFDGSKSKIEDVRTPFNHGKNNKNINITKSSTSKENKELQEHHSNDVSISSTNNKNEISLNKDLKNGDSIIVNNNKDKDSFETRKKRKSSMEDYHSFDYDRDKPIVCFDKIKAHLALIQHKYLLPLVEREDNDFDYDSTFDSPQRRKVKFDDKKDLNIKNTNSDSTGDNYRFERNSNRISELTSKADEADDIYDVSGYVDKDKL